MNLKKLIQEEVKRQLSEAAGWQERHPALNNRMFGQPYSKLYTFLKDLEIFIEQSNVTDNKPEKLKYADSKLVEAYEFAKQKSLIIELKLMMTAMEKAVNDMKQKGNI